VDARPNASAGHGRIGHREQTYTLFEGTSEIQRLVIARAASGMHIP
jgi:alkylation response protein AidB-like acyl-CoA dehydrogenase